MRVQPAAIGIVALLLCAPALAKPPERSKAPAPLTASAIDAATFAALPAKPATRPQPGIVKASVLLARARFSPGSIDGLDGENLRHALAAYQAQSGLPVSGTLDQATWDRLIADKAPVMARYPITKADAEGPFTPEIPAKMDDQGDLGRLGYRDIREMLGERFHMSPALLTALNPGKRFGAGETIDVVAPVGAPAPAKAASVVVDKQAHAVEAFGPDGALLAVFPASVGSEEKPAPTGEFKIRRIVHRPDYTYFPKFHFKGVASKQPFTIAPGPNNPVGIVWMDLSFEGYGIHGTPEPELVGKTQSHGCVRLTNWDAEALASLVDKGTPATFQDGPANPLAPAAGAQPKPSTPPAPGFAPPVTAAPAAPKP